MSNLQVNKLRLKIRTENIISCSRCNTNAYAGLSYKNANISLIAEELFTEGWRVRNNKVLCPSKRHPEDINTEDFADALINQQIDIPGNKLAASCIMSFLMIEDSDRDSELWMNGLKALAALTEVHEDDIYLAIAGEENA